MDALHLTSAWSSANIDSPISIVLTGLLLQGAELHDTRLVEASTDAPELILLPPLAVGYSQTDVSMSSDRLSVPVYNDTSREHFLFEIVLPICEDADIWILAGVAISLSDTS